MRLTLKIVLTILISAATTVFAFEVGGRAGFHEGSCSASHSEDVATAVVALGVLKAEEKGEEGARHILETLLDTAMVMDWAASRGPERRWSWSFAPALFDHDVTPAMERIAEYRQAHPHDPGPHGKEMVEWALARYGTPLQAQH